MDLSRLVETLKPVFLEDTVTGLVPDLRRGETAFVHEFLRHYQPMITTQKLMELLFKKYIPSPSSGAWPSPGLELGMLGITLSLSHLCGK